MTQYPPEQPPPPPTGGAYGAHHVDESKPGRGMAIAALVLGILALLLCWTVIGGILLGLIALVLGIVAAVKARKGRARGAGMAITGAVLGAIGLILAGVLVAVGVSILNSESGQNLQDCLEDAGNDDAAVEQCQQEFEGDLEDQLG